MTIIGNKAFAVGDQGTIITQCVTNPIPSVTIASDINNILAGTSVTFTATPTDGGTSPAYQWKKNGNNVGTNSATYTDAALANNDEVTCVMTNSDPCASPTTATSNAITMTVEAKAWQLSTSGTSSQLNAIWGTDINNVWAVGASGTILKFDGSTWTAQTSNTTAQLTGIWGTDASNIWVVGENGTILKYNGSTWASQTSGITTQLNGIWGTDANNIWAVGEDGVILKYSGSSWAAQTSGTTLQLNGIWGTAASNVWAVGADGTVLKYDGSAWADQSTPPFFHLNGIWATDANNVWAVGVSYIGDPSPLYKYDGMSWTSQNSGTYSTFNSIWGTDANNIWVVGGLGTIHKYDGSAWGDQTSPTTETLRAVKVIDNRVFAVGEQGVIVILCPIPSVTIASDNNNILAGTSVTFTATPTNGGTSPAYQWKKNGNNVGTNSDTYTDAALANNDVITCVMTSNEALASPTTATSNAISMTVEAKTWQLSTSGTTSQLNAIWGTDVTNVWAVGASGTILKFDGSTWTAQTSNTTAQLTGIWGTDASNIWAVGENGTILKYDGSTWASQTSNTTAQLNGIWGTGTNNIWAVGADGVILKYSGSSWAAQTSGTTLQLKGIWGTTANNVWAVGVDGAILKYDGSAWADQSTLPFFHSNGIWGTAANNIWAGGNAVPGGIGGMTTGFISNYNGFTWNPSNTLRIVYSIWGTDANNVWTVGSSHYGSNISKYDGSGWTSQTSPTTEVLRAVKVIDNRVFAVGEQGAIVILRPIPSVTIASDDADNSISAGTSVTFTATPINGGTSPAYQWKKNGNNVGTNSATYTDAALVTNDVITCMMTSNEALASPTTATSNAISITVTQTWQVGTSGTSSQLNAIWGTDVNNVWAVGANGTILKYDGITWTAQTSNTTQLLNGIWGTDASNIWAVGENGTILKYNGSTWASQTSGITTQLNGIWGIDANNIWAVGAGGVILNYDGSSWAGQTSGTTLQLKGIWGIDAYNIWAVGVSGKVLKFDGSTWADQYISGFSHLNSIWGTDANNIWVGGASFIVGDPSPMYKYDGISWAAQTSGTYSPLNSIWGTDANNIWAVGNWGAIRKYDGSAWALQTSPTTQTLRAVKIIGNRAFAAGAAGTIITLCLTNPIPSVTIASDDADNSISAGTSVTFTATPTNGGTSPTYQWKKNGNNVGTNSATYTDVALANNEVITCVMASSEACASPTAATSNAISMTVICPAVPSPTAAATACGFGSVTLSATGSGGDIKWYDNSNHTGAALNASGNSYTSNTVGTNNYYAFEVDANGCFSTTPATTVATVRPSTLPLDIPTAEGTHYATSIITEGGFNHYCNCADNTRLLSLASAYTAAGATLDTDGSPADGAYSVKVDVGNSLFTSITNAPYNILLVSSGGSPSGWKVINRTWDLELGNHLTQEPTFPVQVKSYFTADEYDALNAALATPLSSPSQMTIYKLKNVAGGSMAALNAGHASISSANIYLFNNKTNYTAHWVLDTVSPVPVAIMSATYSVNEFSGGGGGGGNGGIPPFPVEFVSFIGYNNGFANILNWTTATELNNKEFEVLRSVDGILFEKIGMVNSLAPNGTSNSNLSYQFTDNTVLPKSYYRLKQINMNGNSNLSEIIEVSLKNTKPMINFYPNPAHDELNVGILNVKAANYTLEIYNFYGQLLQSQKLITTNGAAFSTISLAEYVNGNYLLVVRNSAGVIEFNEKVVKE